MTDQVGEPGGSGSAALSRHLVADFAARRLRLQVLDEAERDGRVADAGDRSAAERVARQTHQTRQSACADLKLAAALDTENSVLAGGLATGSINLDQARSIERSLDLLPRTCELATTAEQRHMPRSTSSSSPTPTTPRRWTSWVARSTP